jgi:gamma-glutamyltranspeptidase/glutathione hydrolase
VSTYRGLAIAELPPNSAGLIALVILKIVERLDLGGLETDDVRRIDGMVRATRAAFATCRPLIGDPACVPASLGQMLTDEAIERLAEQVRHGDFQTPQQASLAGDTVYVCAVDSEGMACSFIQSVYFPFGSGLVSEKTGVLFQNRGAYFSMDSGHTNALGSRKRPYHTLMPAMAMRDGQPRIVFGTMGGDGQPQTQVQVLSGIVDHGLDVYQAIDAPRWLHGRRFVGEGDDELLLESRFPASIDDALHALGHSVRRTEAWSEAMGHAQAIQITTQGFEGAADRRGDGLALGY